VSLAAAVACAAIAIAQSGVPGRAPGESPDRARVLDAMKRATVFMVEKVSTRGGYVWDYLPDFSRRWGELEARPSMIWIQPPGTATMGHLFLDAYHATGDEYYFRAAARAADALIQGQTAAGGWNYVVDFAGERSLRDWYSTVGRNAWRLEEFQHDWGNATFDDGGTTESARLLLRLYLEKHDPEYKRALDKSLRLVIESQHPVGAWPQRYPPQQKFSNHGRPDYTSYLTFNDDVTSGNIEFLIECFQTLGERRLLDPIARGMHAFVVTQQGQPHPGWALQYTRSLEPAGARTYEPAAIVTHTTAQNIEHMLRFYRLTGDTAFLARIPEALDWLDAVRLPPDVAAIAGGGRTHPTFLAVGTNRPIYVHRRGSNVVNGAYYADGDPHDTVGHYGSFRQIDVVRLRALYEEARAVPPAEVVKGSPLAPGAGVTKPPRYVAVREPPAFLAGGAGAIGERAANIIASLDAEGRWLTELWQTSNPYRGDGPVEVAQGDFRRTSVGDSSDTSPYRAEHMVGLSTRTYIRNMSELIRYLDSGR
jgi:PelA/Pel-15E family pectate lyase